MGVIRRGILGGFSNKVGNIVGSSWKGIAVVKSLPLSVSNPRTAGQVLQRGKFKQLTVLASLLLSAIVKPLWDRFATNMSGYNAFISANRDAFHSNGKINYEEVQMSRGRILAPDIEGAVMSGNNFIIDVGNPDHDRFGLPSDRIYVVVTDAALSKIALAQVTSFTRGAGATVKMTIPIPPGVEQGNCQVSYVGYLRADGSEVSRSSNYVF